MNEGSAEPLGALVACTAILGLGLVDDLRGITALTKLTGQIFCAGLLVLAGVQLQYFVLPGSGRPPGRGPLGAAHGASGSWRS